MGGRDAMLLDHRATNHASAALFRPGNSLDLATVSKMSDPPCPLCPHVSPPHVLQEPCLHLPTGKKACLVMGPTTHPVCACGCVVRTDVENDDGARRQEHELCNADNACNACNGGD